LIISYVWLPLVLEKQDKGSQLMKNGLVVRESHPAIKSFSLVVTLDKLVDGEM